MASNAAPSTAKPAANRQNAQASKIQQYVDGQLTKTCRQVKTNELITAILLWVAGVASFFLVLALIDGWLMPLNTTWRWIAFSTLMLGSLAWLALSIGPLFLRRINPDYAARMIEQAEPGFKNSVLNYVFLRRKPDTMNLAVMDAVSRQAAKNLNALPDDATIDRSRVIRVGFVLVGLMFFAVTYKLISPRDPLQTVQRILFPGELISKPASVQITNVTPGNSRIFFGETVNVAADVKGPHDPADVRLLVSTNDGQVVDHAIPMTADEAGSGYQAILSLDETGIEQSLRYRIEARDGVTPEYRVDVRANPAIAIKSVQLTPPAYTRLPTRTQSGQGDIEAIEGTEAMIHATANLPIEVAYIELLNEVPDPNAGPDQPNATQLKSAAPAIEMRLLDANNATGRFDVSLNSQRTRALATHFQIRFVSKNGDRNETPNVYPIRVTPDLAPEVRIVQPRDRDASVAANGRLSISIEANDLDFAISSVVLNMDHQGAKLLRQSLPLMSDNDNQRVVGTFVFEPQRFRLQPGDQVVFHAVAADNRISIRSLSADPNLSQTENYTISIVDAEPDQADDPKDGDDGNSDPREDKREQDQQDDMQDQDDGSQQPDEQNPTEEPQQPDGDDPNESADDPNQTSEDSNDAGDQGNQPEQDAGSNGEQPEGGGSGSQQQEMTELNGEQTGEQQGSSQSNDGESTEDGAGSGSSDGQSGGSQGGGNQAADNPNGGTPGEPDPSGDSQSSGSNDQADPNAQGSRDPNNGGAKGSQQSGATNNDGSDAGDDGMRDRNLKDGDRERLPKDAHDGDKFEKLEELLKDQPPRGPGNSNNEPNDSTGDLQPAGEPGDQGTPGQPQNAGNDGNQPPDDGASQPGSQGDDPSQQGTGGAGGNEPQTPSEQQSSGGGKQGTSGDGQSPDQPQQPSNQGSAGGSEGSQSSQSEGESDPQQGGSQGSQSQPGDGQSQGSEGSPGSGESAGDSQGSPGTPGDGAAQSSQSDDSSSGSSSGSPSDGQSGSPSENAGNQPGSGSQPAEGSQSGPTGTNPSGSGAGNSQATEEQTPTEKANLDHAKKATDLILNKLEDQQYEPDPELLDKMNWTKQDLRDFLGRWRQMKEQAQAGDAQDRQRYEEAVQSLGLRPDAAKRTLRQHDEDASGLSQDNTVIEPPADLAPDFNEFLRDRNRVR